MAFITRLATTTVALALIPFSTPALAAVPATPVLVGPADGSTSATVDITLSARAIDPDGGALSVRFEGRKSGATVPGGGSGDPFTIVAIPDTQNYTYNNRQSTMVSQTEWIVATRASLNTVLAVQLGDLVSEYDNLTQWGHTSTALKVLDDAGLPNSVVPGNHDFHNASGTFSQYHSYFPPSRYAGKPWTPTSTRYGGYLGQNLFGPDPVDRQNMNSFVLFSAGGRDFLSLNLEWEAPQYALDWASRVLAAHPDRLAILTTHAFVGVNGQRRTTAERPGGTPANTMWTDFVSRQCQIRLVLNGHFHNGDAGEANRSDLNRCGQPVQQVLTDYQDRANGGDGWLRYYTFDPQAGSMKATTYSPTLNRYETDADSSFTVPFDLGQPQPAPFTPITTVQADSGSTATTTWTGLAPDTEYEWRAVSSDGTAAATSPTWKVRTPVRPDLVDDTFTRTVSNGWGAADNDHTWTTRSTATAYSVNGSVGIITAPVGATRGATLSGVSASDVRVSANLSLAAAASGSGAYVSLHGRLSGTTSYRAKLRYLAGGGVTLSLIRFAGAEVELGSAALSGLSIAPRAQLRLVLELEGSSPTTLRAKVWPLTDAEPAAWRVTATDATAALQLPGSTGLDVYTSSSAGSASTVSVDRLTMSRLGSPPPTNQPPTARIADPGISDLTVTLSGSGSTDPDGTITSWRWDYGDSSTGTGATTTHVYPAAGSYPVTLTVTDNAGATATTTRQITVTEPPVAGPLATDDFGRSVTSGWGSADVGGTWSTSGTPAQYAVSEGAGRHIISAPGATTTSFLGQVSTTASEVRVRLWWNRTAATGTIYASALARRLSAASDYRCKVVISANGAVQLQLVRRVNGAETTLSSTTLSGLTHAAGQMYQLACRAIPSGAGSQLRGKLWPAGAAEPVDWLLTSTDATSSLQVNGGVGLSSYSSSGATQPLTTSFDSLVVRTPTP